MKKSLFFLLLLFLFSLVNSTYAMGTVIEGEKSYSGNVELKGEYLIKQGTKISIQPGTILLFMGKVKFSGTGKGKITINGSNNSVIRFVQSEVELKNVEISGLEGIEFIESSAVIENTQLKNNKVSLKVNRNSNTTIKSSLFVSNEIGLAVELKSSCIVEESKFEKNEIGVVLGQQAGAEIIRSGFINNKSGIFVNRDGVLHVSSSKFINNHKGIDIYQNIGSKVIGNLFSKNKTAIFGEVFTQVDVEKNDFIENNAAIDFLQVVTGKIRNNIFRKNATAILLEKKSSPDIRYNSFEENEVGIFCNFSSYPVITRNNFLYNKLHIKLGEFQSADFENRTGSRAIQMKEVVEKQSRRSMQFNEKQKTIYSGEIFAKNNYWDENTLKEFQTKKNVSSIFDGYDLKEVTYEGYGSEKYAIDIVNYKPYLTAPNKITK